MIKPTVADIVQYDSVTSWAPHYPYRSSELYEADEKAVQRIWARESKAVQVIRNHGDSMWTNAEYIRSEPVGDFGMIRYVVRLTDGTEHTVSADRIRLAQ